ncbi:hypothetical protein GALMADRAFT_253046, partial [Galerina marginata CBS 339.88]
MSSTDNNCINRAHIKVDLLNGEKSSNLFIGSGQVVNIYGSTFMRGTHKSVLKNVIVTTNIMQIIHIFDDHLLPKPKDGIYGIENAQPVFHGITQARVSDARFFFGCTQDIFIDDLRNLERSVDESLNEMEGKSFEIFGFSLFDNASELLILGGSYVVNLTQNIHISTKRSVTRDYKRWSKLIGISDFKYFQGANDFRIVNGNFMSNRIPDATGSPFSDLGNIHISGFNAFDGAYDFVLNDIDVTVNCIQSVFINHRPFFSTAVNTVRFGKEYIPRGVSTPASLRPDVLLEQLTRGKGDPNDILHTIPGHVQHLTHHDLLTAGSVNYYNIFQGPVDHGDTFNGDIHGSAAGGRHSSNSLSNNGPSARDTELYNRLKETEERLARLEKHLTAKEPLPEIRLEGMSGNSCSTVQIQT